MPTVTALISLGSNIFPEKHLPAAVRALSGLGCVTAVSSVWESDPVGFREQPRFSNAAVRLETSLSWEELRRRLRQIEDHLGRVRYRDNKNAPRTIDLDIAIYGNLVVADGETTIPDPEIPHRPFLIVPLAEVDPARIHPVLGVSLAELAGRSRQTVELDRNETLTSALANLRATD